MESNHGCCLQQQECDGAMVCHSYRLIWRMESLISTGFSPGIPWVWEMVRPRSHWRKVSMRSLIPDVPSRDIRRVQALRVIRKGDARSGATRDMVVIVDNAVKNLSEREVTPGRRGPGGAVAREAWIY